MNIQKNMKQTQEIPKEPIKDKVSVLAQRKFERMPRRQKKINLVSNKASNFRVRGLTIDCSTCDYDIRIVN